MGLEVAVIVELLLKGLSEWIVGVFAGTGIFIKGTVLWLSYAVVEVPALLLVVVGNFKLLIGVT